MGQLKKKKKKSNFEKKVLHWKKGMAPIKIKDERELEIQLIVPEGTPFCPMSKEELLAAGIGTAGDATHEVTELSLNISKTGFTPKPKSKETTHGH